MEIEAHFTRTNLKKEEEFDTISNILSDYYNFLGEVKPNQEIKYIFGRKNV